MSAEPCMCGATDCRSCGPAQGYRLDSDPDDEGYDEDDPKHSRWADREEDRSDYKAEKAAEDAYFSKLD